MTAFALSWRLVRRAALAWAVASLVMLYAGAFAYRAGFPDQGSRDLFAATSSHSRGLLALYGPAAHLETVGGFVTWRYGTTLAVVLGLWAAMATSRVLRGEEESGRAEVLLAGPRGPLSLLARQAQALGVAMVLIAVAAVLGGLAGDLSLKVSAFLGLQVLSSMVMLASLAAAVSQVVVTRRRCLGAVGGVLAASYLLRAVADGSDHGHALVWASPLGWVEELSAYSSRPWLAAVPSVAFVAASVAATVGLRLRRDAGAGAWTPSHRAGRDRRISSLLRLEVVLGRGALIGWSIGMAGTGLVLGFIATDIAKVADSNPSLSKLDAVAGASVATIKGFLGLSFQLVAVVGALYAGAQVLAARREEESGRLGNLLTAGAGRVRWLVTRLSVATASAVVMTLVAGVAAWLGVVGSGQDLPLTDALRGAVNTLPVILLFLGLTAAAFGLRPRAVSGVVYGSVGLSYFLLIVGAVAGAPGWVLDLSPLAHLAPVPAVRTDVLTCVVLTAVGVLLSIVGGVAFDRRDSIAE